MPQRIALSAPPPNAGLPSWVRAFTQGSTGPGDLSNPMEGVVTVAAQSPALMRRMGEELLTRLEARGDVPENILSALRHVQQRYPRLFGHVDDVRIGPIPGPAHAGPGQRIIGTNIDRETAGWRSNPVVGQDFNPDTDNPFLNLSDDQMNSMGNRYHDLIDEFQAGQRTARKYSTIKVDPNVNPVNTVFHEFSHAPQRVSNPGFEDLYRRQFDANKAVTQDPKLSYENITYEKNADAMAKRLTGEWFQARPEYNAVGSRRRLPLREPMMRHPTTEQISNRYNREALIELMAKKLSGGS